MPFCPKLSLGLMLTLWLTLSSGLALSLTSCDDELLTSPSDQPTLSADSLHMGTLLAGTSSKTYLLKLYNHCSGELKLSSISLRNAETSGFRMNVDGMNGTSFTNSDLLRIAEGDSMFIFVEATFAESNLDIEDHIDYIDILCNQRTRTIVVDAQSQNVDNLQGVTLTADTVWDATGRNKLVYDSLVIPQGVTLTIRDSVVVYLHDKTDIRVRGTLICEGRQGAPVTLRGDRLDKMFDNLPYDNLPSQWGSLYIDSTAVGCRFDYTDIHGMTAGIFVDSTEVTFNSCHLKNSDGNLLTCHMSRMQLYNSELSNAAGALIDLYGGWHDVVHCTLANYNFAEAVSSPALRLSNMDTAQVRPTPLHHCLIQNTIVWGKWCNPDVGLDYWAVSDSVFTYTFDHCLLRANGTDDNDFLSILWNVDPEYKLIDTPNYSFDFHTESDSVRNAGTAEGALTCPLDLDGKARAEFPTIGCYE